jgi:hypothetical protein
MSIYYAPGAQLHAHICCFIAIVIVGIEKITNLGDNEDTNDDRLSQAAVPAFPIIFYGVGIPAGHVQIPVTTDRIAPTIAKSIRIRAPNACTAEPLF